MITYFNLTNLAFPDLFNVHCHKGLRLCTRSNTMKKTNYKLIKQVTNIFADHGEEDKTRRV